jgi:integrative and conjugative element protein (TIGR02256 family)
MLSEDKNRSNRLITIWAHIYFKALTDKDIRKAIFSSNMHNVLIGQSCSSQTMVVDDARISLMAATMSIKIQRYLEMNLPENAEIIFSKYNDDDYSLQTTIYTVPKCIEIKSHINRDWKVLISEPVIKKMKTIMNSKIPNETGGVLIGSIFQFPKTIVVTEIIDAPLDSIESPNFFVLGIDGLKQKIYATEKQTNGKITYLGTWHSHPYGGKASSIDHKTFKHLQFIRNNEPTICIVVTQNEVTLV